MGGGGGGGGVGLNEFFVYGSSLFPGEAAVFVDDRLVVPRLNFSEASDHGTRTVLVSNVRYGTDRTDDLKWKPTLPWLQ